MKLVPFAQQRNHAARVKPNPAVLVCHPVNSRGGELPGARD
jgi:hypothetical protein